MLIPQWLSAVCRKQNGERKLKIIPIIETTQALLEDSYFPPSDRMKETFTGTDSRIDFPVYFEIFEVHDFQNW